MSPNAAQGPLAAAEVFATLDATWPPVRWHDAPGWRVAEGGGGGKRVSAARAVGADPSVAAMERAQAALGQDALVMVTPGAEALDSELDRQGYAIVDPTVALAAPVRAVAGDLPRVTAFEVAWPPLVFQREIWAEGGIGAARLAVMDRVREPRIAMLGRKSDRPCATAFLACHGSVAMLHALEVVPAMRRQGLARHLMVAAARWAERQGAEVLSVLVTRANGPALALYHGSGMQEVTGYHYRLSRGEAAGGADG